MHGSFDRPSETIKSVYRNWGIGVFLLPVLIAVALVGLAMTNPSASNWIAQAAQAEFASPNLAPTQLAQPAMTIRAAKAD